MTIESNKEEIVREKSAPDSIIPNTIKSDYLSCDSYMYDHILSVKNEIEMIQYVEEFRWGMVNPIGIWMLIALKSPSMISFDALKKWEPDVV